MASDAPGEGPTEPRGYWFSQLTRYHWFVLTVAALGWLFDTMDQQLFTLARAPAMAELLATEEGPASPEDTSFYGGLATAIFLIGWATGGLGFGVLGDRIGRARTMIWTILIYSACTGLSALSVGFWDFAFYRFLTGLGVGGEFAVGVALVAEVMPDRARPYALGLLQALSAVGNVSAALINMGLGVMESGGGLESLQVGDQPVQAWRLMFVVGTVPALLALIIRRKLKEPERWQATHDTSKRLGSYADLFSDPQLRRNAIVGLIMAFSGVVGLWGIGFFSYDVFRKVFTAQFEEAGLSPDEVAESVAIWISMTSILQNIGGFFGILAFSWITPFIGRRKAFAFAFVAAMLSTIMVFGLMDDRYQIFWMIPLMGFCQLALFGGYAIYFPELFPTRLRSTGTSFCYNVGRFVAAVGPFTFGYLSGVVFADMGETPDSPMRYAGVTMCAIFLLGLAVLPFAPETKDQPLPE
ncbi:MAG: MFS transporter [Planctomycetota bacterium]|nr:MAG: MFS transporter [Planctomycetota bacterium]